jgi:predicted dehydrogenase
MNTVRWGLLSTANINKRLIPAIRASRRGELVAVASRSQAKANAYAAEWNIPKAYGDYQAMLESGSVDTVYISLPNHLHAEWSIRAMFAGVHVLCEKPFGLNLEEVDRMIETSRQTVRVLSEAFMYRHHPQAKIIGKWVQEGRLGEINVVRGIFNFALQNPDNVRLVPEFGGGCLWDVGIYPLSFAQYIFGLLPEKVSGMAWLGESGVDETFIGQMSYPSGGLAQIASSFRSPYHTHVEVIGTQGRLSATRPFNQVQDSELVYTPQKGRPKKISIPKKELYLGEVEDMHAAILDGQPPYLGLEETRKHIQTVLALLESAKTGKTVNLI